MTRFVSHMRHLLGEVSVWALHTSVLPIGPGSWYKPSKHSLKARMPLPKIAMLNAAIREVAHQLQLGLADWEQMVHLGWERSAVLYDDIHPLKPINDAFGNIYLNALRCIPPRSSLRPTHVASTADGCSRRAAANAPAEEIGTMGG
eukprot:102665-Prymnesium_polylepis.1